MTRHYIKILEELNLPRPNELRNIEEWLEVCGQKIAEMKEHEGKKLLIASMVFYFAYEKLDIKLGENEDLEVRMFRALFRPLLPQGVIPFIPDMDVYVYPPLNFEITRLLIDIVYRLGIYTFIQYSNFRALPKGGEINLLIALAIADAINMHQWAIMNIAYSLYKEEKKEGSNIPVIVELAMAETKTLEVKFKNTREK